jgi:hypothetical protein
MLPLIRTAFDAKSVAYGTCEASVGPRYGTTNGLVNLPPATGTNVPFWYCDSPMVGLMMRGAWPPRAVPGLLNDSGETSPSVL